MRDGVGLGEGAVALDLDQHVAELVHRAAEAVEDRRLQPGDEAVDAALVAAVIVPGVGVVGAPHELGGAAIDAPGIAHERVATGLLGEQGGGLDAAAVRARKGVDRVLARRVAAEIARRERNAADRIDAVPVPRADAARDAPLAGPALEVIDVAEAPDEVAFAAVRRGTDVMGHRVGFRAGVVGRSELDLQVAGEVLGAREMGPDPGLERRDEALDRPLEIAVIVVGTGMVGAEHELGIPAVDASPVAREDVADRLFVAEPRPSFVHGRSCWPARRRLRS